MRKQLHLVTAALAVCLAFAVAGLASARADAYVAVPAKAGPAVGKSAPATASDTEDTRPAGDPGTPSAFAPLAAAAAAGPTPVVLPGLNQPGLGPSRGVNPGDPGAAVGPEHYIQAVNGTGVAVYRRSDLSLLAGPVLGITFAAAPAGQEVLDAQFIWDDTAQRYFYSFTYKAGAYGPGRTSGILYGWTKTADPTDLAHGWCQMRIDTGADFEDRPKLATSASRIVLATNADPIGKPFYSRVWTIPKPANGNTTCPSGAQTGIQTFGTPADPLKTQDGDRADSPVPAIGSDGDANVYIVASDFNDGGTDNEIMVWHVNAAGTLVADGNVAASPYSNPPLAPQASGFDSLDTIDRRLGNAVVRTDPDVGAKALWTQHSIADPAGTGRSVVRWYELIPSACGGGTCAASARRQQGEVKDPSNWLWNAAVAPTGAGNEAVLQYNSASSTQTPQIHATSRVSSTPLGTMGGEVTVATSDGPDRDFTCFDSRPGCRWGDYTMASPDPNDPHLVWASNQVVGPYTGSTHTLHWKSRNFAVQPTASAALVHSGTGAADTGAGGDADGVVEPGESAELTETVRNAGGAAATGVTGTLQSLTTGLSVTSATSSYPNVAAGGTSTGASPFAVTAANSLPCGTPLSMSLSLNTSQGRYRVPVSVATGSADAERSTNATDVPKSIPDGNAAGVNSSVTVTGSGTIADLEVSIAKITHPWVGDLQIELIGPDGTRVVLADRPGGLFNDGDNFVNTVFSDDASAVAIGSASAPYTGKFKPQAGRLAVFKGKPVAGTWTLHVTDPAAGDAGTLDGWGVRTSAASCNAKPVAAFHAAPNPVQTKTAVTFTSDSSDPDGSIASLAWDLDHDGSFDDGTGTTESRSFAKAGTYTVGLEVTDDDGATDTTTRTVTVTNQKPVASFTALPSPVATGSSVAFTSTATDNDGTIASQAWDLDNDGQYDDGTATTASRSFDKSGTYTVGLKVTDDNGESSTTTRQVVVTNRRPTAAFSAPPGPVASQTPVTFTSTSTDPDGSIASQAWDLDDDGQFDDAAGASASRSFPRSGSYDVWLKVTDDEGATDTLKRTVTVTNQKPSASFGLSPTTAPTKTTVTFTSTSTDPDGSVAGLAWDLDDDGSFDDGTGTTEARSFPKAGTYTVTLKVTDNEGATSTATHDVTVTNQKPLPSFTASPNPAPTGSSVAFTSTATDDDGTIASQAWDLDHDGAYDDGTAKTASRTFTKSGTYTVALKVIDDNGASEVTALDVTVTNRRPVADFSATPNPVSSQTPVTFTSTSTDPDGSVASQAWDLDADGQYDDAAGASASRSFPHAGSYDVWLQVTDDEGATDTFKRTVAVTNRKPAAAFSAAPSPVASKTPVTFTSTSSDPDGSVASQAWDLDNDGSFDDGTGTSEARSFAKAGSYTVGLRVTDNDGGTDATTRTVTVKNQTPVAAFTVSENPVPTQTAVTFTSTATDPDGTIASQAWDLDADGSYDDGTGETASRSFPKAASYTVALKVTDDNGGTDTTTHTVVVGGRSPTASFTVDPQTVKPGVASRFDASASGDPDGSVERYQWDLDGDGSFETDSGSDPVTSRFYGTPGNVVVGLQVTDDDGLTATTERTVTVTEPDPFATDPNQPPPGTGPLPGVNDPPAPPDPGDPPDPPAEKAPRGALRVVRSRLDDALAHGLALRFSSDQAVTVKLRATVSARDARRFRVVPAARKTVTIGSSTRLAGSGRTGLRLKLSRKLRAPRRRAALPVTVKMTLIGASGLSRTYTVHAVLRRG